MDGAGQLGVRFVRLGRDDDVGAVAGRTQGDGQADASAGARDEERLARQVSLVVHRRPPDLVRDRGRCNLTPITGLRHSLTRLFASAIEGALRRRAPSRSSHAPRGRGRSSVGRARRSQ